MPGPHMTAPELAQELGRSTSWLYSCWGNLVTDTGMPPPVVPGTLIWSRAQIYAWLDRRLSDNQRIAAMAYRAAAAAAANEPLVADTATEIEQSRNHLNKELGLS